MHVAVLMMECAFAKTCRCHALQVRAVWLGRTIGCIDGLGTQQLFDTFDTERQGILHPHDALRLLAALGCPGLPLLQRDTPAAAVAPHVPEALDWCEAMDEDRDWIVSYEDFAAFVASASDCIPAAATAEKVVPQVWGCVRGAGASEGVPEAVWQAVGEGR